MWRYLKAQVFKCKPHTTNTLKDFIHHEVTEGPEVMTPRMLQNIMVRPQESIAHEYSDFMNKTKLQISLFLMMEKTFEKDLCFLSYQVSKPKRFFSWTLCYLSIYLSIYLSTYFHHTACESTCDTLSSSAANQGDNTVSVAQGGTATPGATKQPLPGSKSIYSFISIYKSVCVFVEIY